MMRHFFNTLAARFQNGLETHDQIHTRLRNMDLDRIACVGDLERCFFYKNDIQSRGFTGARFLLNSENIIESLNIKTRHGMFLGDIPASLAKERTKGRLYSQALARIVANPSFEIDESPSDDELDSLEQEIEAELAKETRLQLIYVGDYLDVVDKIISLPLSLSIDVLFGKGPVALDLIKEVETVHDYSEYAHDRPPRNGKPTHKDKTALFGNPALQ